MPTEFSLDALKKDIEERNKETLIREEAMGKTGIRKTDRMSFLTNLIKSVESGTGANNNPSVLAIRAVSESVDAVHGIVAPTTHQPHMNIPQPQQPNYGGGGEYDDRSEGYFRQQQRLAEERLAQTNRIPQAQPTNNGGLSQVLTEYAKTPYVGQPNYGGGINAQLLNEHITKTMNEVLNSAMADKLVEGMTKNILSEVYARERVEKVVKSLIDDGTFRKMLIDGLVENDKYRKIVISTVKELADRKKAEEAKKRS